MTYTEPALTALFLLALIGYFRRSRVLLGAGLAGLFLWSWPPAAWITSSALERWYKPGMPQIAGAQAIVVLSGGALPRDAGRPEALPEGSTYRRTRYGAWLHRQTSLPVFVTGGRSGSEADAPILAELMRQVLLANNVPREAIRVEPRADSTYTNALYTAEMLRAAGVSKIVLVTEATHMPRAHLVFRKQGLDVVAAPCEFRTLRFGEGLSDYLPSATAISQNDDVLHEWVGLIWYKLSGRI